MGEIAYCNVGQHGLENLSAEVSRVKSLDPTENEDPCRLLQKKCSTEPWIICSVKVAKLRCLVLLAQIFLMLYKSPCVCGSLELCLLVFGGDQASLGKGRKRKGVGIRETPPYFDTLILH